MLGLVNSWRAKQHSHFLDPGHDLRWMILEFPNFKNSLASLDRFPTLAETLKHEHPYFDFPCTNVVLYFYSMAIPKI